MQHHGDLPPDIAALMAATRLTLCPDDGQALADLAARAGRLVADGSDSRRAFVVAAQACACAPTPARIAALRVAMLDFNAADLLPLSSPSQDGRFRGRAWSGRGGNGVARSAPIDPDDLILDA